MARIQKIDFIQSYGSNTSSMSSMAQPSAFSDDLSSSNRKKSSLRVAVKYNCEPLGPVAGDDHHGPSYDIDMSEEELEFKEQNNSK
jgi:hypothetical protein